MAIMRNVMPELGDTVSPNQIVAWNLKRARLMDNLDQRAAAAKLAEYLPEPWSVGTYHNNERARVGRVKKFSANEIVSLALAFGRPLLWFFLPPDPRFSRNEPVPIDITGAVEEPGERPARRREPGSTLIRLMSASQEINAEMRDRARLIMRLEQRADTLSRARMTEDAEEETLKEALEDYVSFPLPSLGLEMESAEDLRLRALERRIEGLEAALGTGERKDSPNAWSHTEEG